jgi:acetyl esterase/lipase
MTLGVGMAPAREKPVAAEARMSEYEVERIADLEYHSGSNTDVRHRLDLYVPVGAKNYPVMIYVHGGGWKSGSKTLYIGLGRAFARHGIGVAIINYRLSPKVLHPSHAEDVAKAFAWVHGNIAKYGGDAENITLMGHSAGGHLAALLATDPNYLKAEKLEPSQIRGIISVSGVYRIDPAGDLFTPAFGSDADSCRKASPLSYVTGNHPPFLIAYAENDYTTFDRMAMEFHAALEKAKSPTSILKVEARNHISIIVSILSDADPLNEAVRKFILK